MATVVLARVAELVTQVVWDVAVGGEFVVGVLGGGEVEAELALEGDGVKGSALLGEGEGAVGVVSSHAPAPN